MVDRVKQNGFHIIVKTPVLTFSKLLKALYQLYRKTKTLILL